MLMMTILGWTILIATALFLGKGAIDKIRGTQEMVGNFTFMKLEDYRILIGGGELFAAALLVCPFLSVYGMILTLCFMSGAIALHLSLMGGNKTIIPALVGAGAVIGYLLANCI